MPRNDLTLSSKIALLDKIKSQPPNTSHRRLSEITGVPRSTISRVLQQESKLREELLLQGQGTLKRRREGKNPDVEEALNQWFSVVSGRGVNINGPILKAKSEELAKKLGHNDFKATDGWLSRWKARRNIKFKKTHDEKDTADKESFEEWEAMKIPSFLEISIVEGIRSKQEKLDEDDDDNDELPVPVTNQEAKKCIAVLQRYFMQEGNEGSPTSALNKCADFVELKCNKNKTDCT